MRQLILIGIIISSNLILAQSELTITPCFCESEKRVSNFDHKIEFYKKDSLITNEFYPINNFTVSGLEKGKYLLKYKSIFNQDFKTEISLNKKEKGLKICIDDFRPKEQTTIIEELNLGDTLEIWAYSTGCEFDDFGKIQLTKIGIETKVTLIKNGIMSEKILSGKEFNIIKEMEQKILLIKDNEETGYSSTYNYEIKLNGIEKIKTFYGIDLLEYRNNLKKIFKIKN